MLSTLFADEPVRPGIVRGRLQKISTTSITLTNADGQTIQCGLDNKTYMERDGQRIFAGALQLNDPLEIIADRQASAGTCYARSVRIVAPGTRLIVRPYRSSLEYLYPRGNMTFSGVVRRVNANVMVLRTKDEPERLILLREDTRFLQSGFPVFRENLAVNTRVFIRGGRNIDNDLEAYQVIWGEIEGPTAGTN
jgi:hypothetical protein